MTVHAAKGLEFPVVFVVNLSKGTGSSRPAIRVGYDDEQGEPWVSIGDFQSEADQDARARDREETKRLLYVALTRARDRLYLSSEAKGGRWKPVPGSLAQVLPASFGSVFEAACALAAGEVDWRAEGGRSHRFRICPIAAPQEPTVAPPPPPSSEDREGGESVDDFAVLPDSRAVLRVAVTAATASAGTEASSPAPGPAVTADADQALIGTLVHRLFERDAGNAGGDQDLEAVTARVRRLVRDDEMAGVGNLDDVSRQSALAYLALCSQPGVVSELAGAETWFEVPFSVRPAGAQAVLRGRFDCVVRHAGGRIVVLEFKTGSPAAQHQHQLDAYLTAARALFPDSVVDGRLVYAPDAPLPHIRARLSGETQD